jgi:hypothetical protein
LQVKVLELAAKELQDDCFGFRLARDFELGEIGLLYYVMASSERLIDALRNAARYCAINNEGVRLQISLERTFVIEFEYLNINRLSNRHHMEFWLVTLVRICRALTGSRIAPKQIKLRHSRAEISPDVQSYLGCEIDFAAKNDEINFSARIGTLPVAGADVYLMSYCFNTPRRQSEAEHRGAPASVLLSKGRSRNCFRTAKLTRWRLAVA